MRAEFSNSFLKNLSKLNSPIKDKIKLKLKQILIDPEIGIPLKHNLKPYWKLRIQNYRIIYSFDDKKIYFYALNHRKNIYKKLT